MRKFILVSLLLSVTFLCSEETQSIETRRSLFNYIQSQGLPGQVRYRQDIVVLRDGTLLSGDLEDLPSLKYIFGKVPLELNDVTLISWEPSTSGKWRVLTSSGMRYVASISDENVFFIESIPNPKGIISKELRKIRVNEVSFILLKPREQTHARTAYRLTFTNGDELPVDLVDREISMNDGWSKRVIKTTDIIDVSFNGVLQGTIKGRDGEEEELGLNFVDKPNITVAMLHNKDTLRLPWKNVANIIESSKEGYRDFNQLLHETYTTTKPNPHSSVKKDEPPPLLTVTSEIEIPEIDFKVEPEPMLAATEEIQIPEINFILNKQPVRIPSCGGLKNINTKGMITFTEEIDFGEDIDFGGESNESATDKSLEEEQAEKTESQEENEIIFISEGRGEKQPFLLAVDSKKNDESIVFNLPKELTPSKKINTIVQKVTSPPSGTYEGLQYVAATNSNNASFYIKERKVSNKEYQRFVNAVNYKAPSHWVGGQIPPGLENEPVVNITYKDTLLYSVWIGKRLPTEQELNNAANQAGVLSDRNDLINEWTSTPHVHDDKAYGKQAPASARIGGGLSSGHIIYGKTNPRPMRNNEYNAQTGFRLAANAQ